MRKFWILLFFFISLNIKAQFEVGLNTGISFNHTNKSDERFYSFGNYTSFYPEINAGYSFGNHWSIHGGLGFSSKGYKVIPGSEIPDEKEAYCKFRYFSLPLSLTYGRSFKSFYGKLSAGFQPNFIYRQNTPLRYEEDFRQMNLTVGLLLGAEIGYRLSEQLRLHIAYRYTPDLNDADKLEFQGRFRSNIMMVGVTYVIERLKQKM